MVKQLQQLPGQPLTTGRGIIILSILSVLSLILLLTLPLPPGGPAAAQESQPSDSLRVPPQVGTGTAPAAARGVWIDVKSIPSDPAAIRAMVQRLKRANFNMIFPEVFYQGSTIFFSETAASEGIQPQLPRFSGMDPLAILIDEAHKLSIEVHAWFSMFYVGLNAPGPVLTRHPEWAAIDRHGEIGYKQGVNRFYWVCPMHPGVREYYTRLIREVIQKYDVDGIHLDYIRYPDPTLGDFCYSPEHREEFRAKYGIDPLDLDPEANPEEYKLWNKVRADAVTSVVRAIAGELRQLRPGAKLSCAVAPRGMPIELNQGLLQDWPEWASKGYIDLLIPMTYSSRPNEMRALLIWAQYFTRGAVPVYAGIQGFGLPGPEGLLAQVNSALEQGAKGVVIFAYPYLTDECLAALRAGPFAEAERKGENDHPPFEHQGPPGPPRMIRATRVDTPPVIDGLVDDEVWQAAEWQTDFKLITGEGDAREQTWVAVCYDDSNLYIAFRMADDRPDLIGASITSRDGPVFYDDSVEVFLDTAHTHSFYYHFAVNLFGTQYDSYSRIGPSWNGTWRAGAATTGSGWSAEMAIPLAEVAKSPPVAGTIWGVNFNRTMLRLQEFSGWAFTPGTFHAPSFFGDIMFD
ncbi:MAG TPA: family 10 glycosylhydrolase [Firmicutes bacterium]|nr:family 10 glycosylhydrolase [Bacillota bacterium]